MVCAVSPSTWQTCKLFFFRVYMQKVPGPGTYEKIFQFPIPPTVAKMGRQYGLFFTSAFQSWISPTSMSVGHESRSKGCPQTWKTSGLPTTMSDLSTCDLHTWFLKKLLCVSNLIDVFDRHDKRQLSSHTWQFMIMSMIYLLPPSTMTFKCEFCSHLCHHRAVLMWPGMFVVVASNILYILLNL